MKNLITSADRESFTAELYRIFTLNKMERHLADGGDERFFRLACLLTEFNAHTNLTAITDPSGVILRHLVDSLTALDEIPSGARVADVGTGGGFPAIPISLVRPDLTVVGIDSTQKKLRFSELVAEKLEISGLSTLCGRAEELARRADLRESFDVVTARAVASLSVLTELCLPLVKVGGRFIALKGAGAEAELAESRAALDKLGGARVTVKTAHITGDGTEFESRYVICADKQRRTPDAYPRQYNKIKAQPIR